MMSPRFLFDLDGTVVDTELLPLIAREIGREREIAELTQKAMAGLIPFEVGFRHRVELLSPIGVKRISEIVAAAPINPFIGDFIQEHRDKCTIVTGNCDLWIAGLVAQLGCSVASSTATETADGALRIRSVIDKAEIARSFSGCVIAVGDGANDVGMLQWATYGIAYGGVHRPAAILLDVATHAIYQADKLCFLLSRYL